jgi:uncharacterized protein with HEPN domain
MRNEDYKYALEAILNHLEICESRFLCIQTPDDFVNTNQGLILLDSIVTRLQAIGENIKSILRKSNLLKEKYSEVEWDKIIRFRDFISHHYEMLDYEIVFEIGQNYLPKLKEIILLELETSNE